ncbi:MAG: hypothetical protein KKC30_15745 [Proteobacteria bacterium]|nr:hypothetical protein [Pseudomonadota bacterium]MBU4381586.1 hypothetical protein [Pseudomonadota bacterium]MCG2766572.1 hypothetical protein [Desulfarculaceae bacterium]
MEKLDFKPGVNLLVGLSNTGKTNWLHTLDYLLGRSGDNPFVGYEDNGLADTYDAARVELIIAGKTYLIERRWLELGAKNKVFVDGEGMPVKNYQDFLMQSLGIPLLHFPKGNPMSGRTWPELSFRMLLRHIYRRQRFWGGIADKQPDVEQHAVLMQFLGIAERIYTKEFGELINLKMQVERLKSRRDQYKETLDELAGDILSGPNLRVSSSVRTIKNAEERLSREVDSFRLRRLELLNNARDKVVSPEQRNWTIKLGEERASVLTKLEDLNMKYKAASARIAEMQGYRADVQDELERVSRAEDAGAVLADLKITNCPACDQSVSDTSEDPRKCFLCHQDMPDQPLIEELGTARIHFERDRLEGEIKETNELIGVLHSEKNRTVENIHVFEERLRKLNSQLAVSREAVSALVQDEVSSIDMTLGELNERQRQISRLADALKIGERLTDKIRQLEKLIEPLEAHISETVSSIDFERYASQLEDGMNLYLDKINQLRPNVWCHSRVSFDISQNRFNLRIGGRRWHAALGGTDTLYFLMAYHYGLLSLSSSPDCHYPGLSIIDLPGKFSGEPVKDKENFIVQPFIELLNENEFTGAQLIMTGESFAGLEQANRVELTRRYVS